MKSSLQRFFSEKQLSPLFDEVERLLRQHEETIVFTWGRDVSVIGSSILDIPGIPKATHITLDRKHLQQSWVYSIQGKRKVEIKPDVTLDCFLLVPTRQPDVMVLAHEFLHIIQNLSNEIPSSESGEIYPYSKKWACDDEALQSKVSVSLSSLWTSSCEVGAIVGLDDESYKGRITENTLRPLFGLAPRLFHQGGLGDLPLGGVYALCALHPFIDPSSIRDMPVVVSFAEMKATQRLMNWLDGIGESFISDSIKATPVVSEGSSGQGATHPFGSHAMLEGYLANLNSNPSSLKSGASTSGTPRQGDYNAATGGDNE